VQGGAADSVDLLTPRQLFATVPHGERDTVKMRVTYDGPLKAPIAKGEEIGKLEVTIGHDAPTTMPLVAGSDVPKGGLADRLRQGFRRMLS
jgi:D-alanyl-D-alanine carboxypeptidase (penicillin-binding protein 5/6)